MVFRGQSEGKSIFAAFGWGKFWGEQQAAVAIVAAACIFKIACRCCLPLSMCSRDTATTFRLIVRPRDGQPAGSPVPFRCYLSIGSQQMPLGALKRNRSESSVLSLVREFPPNARRGERCVCLAAHGPIVGCSRSSAQSERCDRRSPLT